jgi:hypothetical protein
MAAQTVVIGDGLERLAGLGTLAVDVHSSAARIAVNVVVAAVVVFPCFHFGIRDASNAAAGDGWRGGGAQQLARRT